MCDVCCRMHESQSAWPYYAENRVKFQKHKNMTAPGQIRDYCDGLVTSCVLPWYPSIRLWMHYFGISLLWVKC